MECLGQGFALPLDAAEIISGGIEVYRRWLLEERARPPPIQEDLQFFIKEMLKHMSQVFLLRANFDMDQIPTASDPKVAVKVEKEAVSMIQDLITNHTRMCNDVLEIFRQVGRKLVRVKSQDCL
jgi:hypothetical protein